MVATDHLTHYTGRVDFLVCGVTYGVHCCEGDNARFGVDGV